MKENNIGQELSLNTIYNMDCLEGMKLLADNSVDAIVTDPPYGLSFMGKKRDYDVPSQEIREEALRVLKPGGYLLAFAGTRTQHRMAVRIEDAGFEIRDMLAWVYGSGFPKSLNIGKAVDKLQGNEREDLGYNPNGRQNCEGKQMDTMGGKMQWSNITKGTSEWEGWGTALKPALEPITVARKPLDKGLTVAENCLKWGVGGINIDESRVGTEVITQNQYDRTPEHGNQYGNGAERKQNGIQTQTVGRFPANLIHDGSDEVVELFPKVKTGSITKDIQGRESNSLGKFNQFTGRHTGDSGSASRFFYCAKASKSERNKGCEGLEEKIVNDGREKDIDNAYQRGITLRKNTHPTVKPIALMEYLVKLVSREDAVVLDPFTGSGSTLIACKKLKRQYIGFELDEDYITIAEARLQSIKSENTLFS